MLLIIQTILIELSNKNEIHQANSKIKFPENSWISPERDKGLYLFILNKVNISIDKILISNFYHWDNGPSDYTNTSTPKTSAPLNGSEEKLNSRYRWKYRDILAKKYNGQPELVNESNEATNNKIAENRYEYYSR